MAPVIRLARGPTSRTLLRCTQLEVEAIPQTRLCSTRTCQTTPSTIKSSNALSIRRRNSHHGQLLPAAVSTNQRSWYSNSKEAASTNAPTVHSIYEKMTGTFQYLVVDPASSVAVIIDPVLDYDPTTHEVRTTSADSLLAKISQEGLTVDMILETHAHADHLSAASYLQSKLTEKQEAGHRPRIGIGKRIDQVQRRFGERYGIPGQEYEMVFDKVFEDNEQFCVGDIKAMAIHIPGHTPDHMGYLIGDNIFCGDSIFNADLGSARADFPGGSATDLFKSARKLLSFPGHVKIWTGHDYPSEERGEPMPCMTVEEHRKLNKHVMDGVTEEEFVKMRQERDELLAAPKLIHQSLQVNIRGGKLPAESRDGQRMLHLPLKLGDVKW